MNLYLFAVLGVLVSSSAGGHPEDHPAQLHDGLRVRFGIKDLGKKQTAGNCTEEQVDDVFDSIEDYKECKKLLDDCDAASCPDSEFHNLTCTGNCFEAYTTFYQRCNLTAGEQAYYADCGIGPGGDRCLSIDVMQLRSEDPALESALSNCPFMASADCTDICKQSIENVTDIYGCCLNNYLNNSVVADYNSLNSYSYLVSYDLWSACGVPTTGIGFCSLILEVDVGSAWEKSSSAVFGAALIAVLMSLMI